MNQSHAIQEPVQQFRRQQADTKDHEEKHHAGAERIQPLARQHYHVEDSAETETVQDSRFIAIALPVAQLIQPVEPFNNQPYRHGAQRYEPDAAHHHQRANQRRRNRQPRMVV